MLDIFSCVIGGVTLGVAGYYLFMGGPVWWGVTLLCIGAVNVAIGSSHLQERLHKANITEENEDE